MESSDVVLQADQVAGPAGTFGLHVHPSSPRGAGCLPLIQSIDPTLSCVLDGVPGMPTFTALVGVARGPFLLLSITLVAAGAASAAYDGSFLWSRTLLAAVGLVALHIAVNALNEASDMRSGIDLRTKRTPFSGGSGTLPSGAMSERGALAVGLVTAGIGLAVGLWLLPRVGLALVPIMLVGAVLVLGYTDTLARMGVGEFAAGLGLGALPVVGTALVQDGTIGAAAIAAAVPAFFMTFNLLLLNEFPDEEADRAGGRRNLVLLLGRGGAAKVYAILAVATPISIAVSVALGALPSMALLATLPSLLLAKPIGWALGRPHEPVPLPALGSNVVWNLTTNTVVAISLIAAIWLR
jgi:1,4-dihydroxy-2-naphthoate polyprenyltransferase